MQKKKRPTSFSESNEWSLSVYTWFSSQESYKIYIFLWFDIAGVSVSCSFHQVALMFSVK